MATVSLPQGFRDFDSATVHKRQYILNTIKSVFELYGFAPLETPAMENLETLMGKYGDEGDKLIFKVLNNGLSDPKNTEKAKEGFDAMLSGKSNSKLTERAMKYDLTIPFARYVAMNKNLIQFPFKRYQVQTVWRADRPQKGRYREFTQCDADVVGSMSKWSEVELAMMYHEVFTRLKLTDYTLSINNRKILSALANLCGGKELMTTITAAIDKLDKIGIDKVLESLSFSGLNQAQIDTVQKYLAIEGNNEAKLLAVEGMFADDAEAKAGIEELRFMVQHCTEAKINIDFTLARGLNYYTGIIFEVKAPLSVKMGSIGGGGRYDDLTGLFGVPGITGVGISFGVDRIYDVLEELNFFPQNINSSLQVLFLNLGENEAAFSFGQVQQLRRAGIRADLYHEAAKMDKQFKYAEKKLVPIVIIIGGEEMNSGIVRVKILANGKQENVKLEALATFIKDQ